MSNAGLVSMIACGLLGAISFPLGLGWFKIEGGFNLKGAIVNLLGVFAITTLCFKYIH